MSHPCLSQSKSLSRRTRSPSGLKEDEAEGCVFQTGAMAQHQVLMAVSGNAQAMLPLGCRGPDLLKDQLEQTAGPPALSVGT